MILDYEIIVSFSASDNAPGNSGNGWIMQFSQYLKATLIHITGNQPKLIFHSDDEQYDTSRYHQNTIVIMIISPQYINAGLYEKELKGITGSGLNMEEAAGKIFNIIKQPIDDSSFPVAIKNFKTYSFHKETSKKYQALQEEWHPDLCMKVLDLSFDIHNIIEEKRKNIFGINGKIKAPVKKIYLALTGKDLYSHREIIHRELVRQHIEVHPASNLPDEIVDLEFKIRKEMEMCELSIHLIGEDYGYIPKGSDKSIVDIQNKLAVEISSDPFRNKLNVTKQFSRYVWISPELNKLQEKQKIFIENIKRDNKALKEDEILQVPFDELKEIIQNKIVFNQNNNEKFYTKTITVNKGKGTIYLIYERVDQQLSDEIAAYLEVEGYDVIFPDFSGDQLSIRKKHQEYLRSCDASLILCGEVNLEWINIKLQDVIKAPGFGRTKPFKAKALFIKNEKYQHFHDKLMNLDGSLILESSVKFIPDNFFLFLNKITA